jgi:hypothetical protein
MCSHRKLDAFVLRIPFILTLHRGERESIGSSRVDASMRYQHVAILLRDAGPLLKAAGFSYSATVRCDRMRRSRRYVRSSAPDPLGMGAEERTYRLDRLELL